MSRFTTCRRLACVAVIAWAAATPGLAPAQSADGDQAPAELAQVEQLVRDGKFDQAVQAVAALREAAPDDARLEALERELRELAAAQDSGESAHPAQPTKDQPPAAPTPASPPATGDISPVQWKMVQMVLADAQAAPAGSPQRAQGMEELLARTQPLVEQHPDMTQLWLLRGLAALELDHLPEGFEAAQNLQRLDAAQSADDLTLTVLAGLTRRGWLTHDPAKLAELRSVVEKEMRRRAALPIWLGTWKEKPITRNWVGPRNGLYSYEEFEPWSQFISSSRSLQLKSLPPTGAPDATYRWKTDYRGSTYYSAEYGSVAIHHKDKSVGEVPGEYRGSREVERRGSRGFDSETGTDWNKSMGATRFVSATFDASTRKLDLTRTSRGQSSSNDDPNPTPEEWVTHLRYYYEPRADVLVFISEEEWKMPLPELAEKIKRELASSKEAPEISVHWFYGPTILGRTVYHRVGDPPAVVLVARARALAEQGSAENLSEARKLLAQALKQEPGHSEAAALLEQVKARQTELEAQAEQRRQRDEAFVAAIVQDDAAAVRRLLAAGCDPNRGVKFQNRTFLPLCIAAFYGSLNAAEALIEAGADVNVLGPADLTPLMQAASNDQAEMVAYLLKQGADKHMLSGANRNALRYAVLNKHEKCIQLLLDNPK